MKTNQLVRVATTLVLATIAFSAGPANADEDAIEIIETADGQLVPKIPARSLGHQQENNLAEDQRPDQMEPDISAILRRRRERRSAQLFGHGVQHASHIEANAQFEVYPEATVYGSGGACDCQPCRQGRWIGGLGLYFLKPYWSHNIAYATVNLATFQNNAFDFDWDTELAPLVWFGYVGPDGFGGRVRFWQFDHSSKTARFAGNPLIAGLVPFPPGTGQFAFTIGGQSIQAASSLEMNVLDLEGLGEFRHKCWLITATAGVRYANIKQGYQATTRNNPQSQFFFLNTFTNNQRFRGTGPTMSLEGRRNLRINGLSLFANSRGSLLFGHHTQTSTSTYSPAGPPSESFRYSRWGLLPVLEAEIGTSYCWNTFLGRWTLEAALVGQAWLGLGNASNTEFANTILGSPPTVSWNPDYDANLGMLGGRLTLGLDY